MLFSESFYLLRKRFVKSTNYLLSYQLDPISFEDFYSDDGRLLPVKPRTGIHF